MIITTEEELRLAIPSHAIDHVEALAGFITNSEHDFLRQPLGQPLYDHLCQYYDRLRDGSVDGGISAVITALQQNALGSRYNARLLFLAQRCVAFDALASAIDVQAVSLNNAGVNFATADDYQQASDRAIANAKTAYQREARKALNILLEALEQWTQDCPAPEDATEDDAEMLEIVNLWRSSRYFYLAAQLLIPSARVLQEYLNIYDSRERFIQMLPDLHFIQEEQIAGVVGEDFTERLVTLQLKGGTKRDATAATSATPVSLADDAAIPPMLRRLLHKLRKIEATMLEARTVVMKIDKERRIAARDESVRLLATLREYCQQHQADILRALDQAAGFPPTAAALLTEADRALIEEDILQGCLEAEAPYTSSPYFLAPAAPNQGAGTTSEAATRPCCPRRSVNGGTSAVDVSGSHDALLVTPPLL